MRNLVHLGQLFPLNTDLPGATQAWWQQPGYYTPAFFLHFGDALRHPFAVELGHLLDEVVVLEEQGPVRPDRQRVLVARCVDPGVGRRRRSSPCQMKLVRLSSPDSSMRK